MMEALADFGTVATFGYRTLTESIYRVWYGMFDRAAAAQLASLLLLFALGLLALDLAYAARLPPSAVVRFSARSASMGYALPGAVIAVGVLVPMAWIDHLIAGATARMLDRPAGLLLTGSAAGLLFAYIARFLSVGFQTLEASLGTIPPSM